ncbi:MAG: hypothetical protein ABI039_11825 [Vicinamibacterales bacterium]
MRRIRPLLVEDVAVLVPLASVTVSRRDHAARNGRRSGSGARAERRSRWTGPQAPLAGSIVYATARSVEGIIWTKDEDFAGLADVQYVPKRADS